MDSLISQKCVACKADAPKVTDDELAELLKEIPEWKLITKESMLRLQRVFEFQGYSSAVQFTNKIADLAEQEDHHPAILLEWGKVEVTWWTHKILGLHKNDFIAAAKTDLVFNQ
tara:strand:+ start:142 stop:483 length:342 start_codon:yes stop_codon:yes gene_type:complete